MAAKKITTSKKIYTCVTCGKVTTSKGHLCAPIPQEKTTICEFCGAVGTNLRHICAPKVIKFKFACSTCGRASVSKTNLCAPKAITQPKTATSKKTPAKKIGNTESKKGK